MIIFKKEISIETIKQNWGWKTGRGKVLAIAGKNQINVSFQSIMVNLEYLLKQWKQWKLIFWFWESLWHDYKIWIISTDNSFIIKCISFKRRLSILKLQNRCLPFLSSRVSFFSCCSLRQIHFCLKNKLIKNLRKISFEKYKLKNKMCTLIDPLELPYLKKTTDLLWKFLTFP